MYTTMTILLPCCYSMQYKLGGAVGQEERRKGIGSPPRIEMQSTWFVFLGIVEYRKHWLIPMIGLVTFNFYCCDGCVVGYTPSFCFSPCVLFQINSCFFHVL